MEKAADPAALKWKILKITNLIRVNKIIVIICYTDCIKNINILVNLTITIVRNSNNIIYSINNKIRIRIKIIIIKEINQIRKKEVRVLQARNKFNKINLEIITKVEVAQEIHSRDNNSSSGLIKINIVTIRKINLIINNKINNNLLQDQEVDKTPIYIEINKEEIRIQGL